MKRARRGTVRHLQIAALAVAVVAGSVGGTIGLVRVFRADRGSRAGGGGSSPDVTPSGTVPPTSTPSPSESPTASPTPSPSGTAGGPFIGYSCGSSTISADYDGDGLLDTAMVHFSDVVQGTPPPCPSPAPGDPEDWRIDVAWGDGVAGSWKLPECSAECRADSAFDLDGNGTAELAVGIDTGASTEFLNVFELPPQEPGPILLGESAEALRLPRGGSVTHLDFVSCQTDSSGAGQLVTTAAQLSQDGSTWTLTETVHAYDPSAPAGGDPRMAEAFSVVSTNESTQPADPNGAPPTIQGSPCFVPEGGEGRVRAG